MILVVMLWSSKNWIVLQTSSAMDENLNLDWQGT